MENLRRSKKVALDLLEDTKDIYDGISVESPTDPVRKSSHSNVDIEAGPSTSKDKAKRPTEFVKYGKITFNTTAILHHYPQMSKNCSESCKTSVATKKSDLNLPLKLQTDNNNDDHDKSKPVETDKKDKDNFNNNKTVVKSNCVVKADNTVEILKKPVKFTEEKLV